MKLIEKVRAAMSQKDIGQTLSKDFVSGFIVFLLALPLSIGIALASGFPAMSGLITAAIGGLVVAPFAGSPMSIKGPAAGMIVIMLGAVDELGKGDTMQGVRLALAAVAVTGVLQIIMGKIQLAKVARAFPESAMKGMLAAIGIIIISKQFHLMLGTTPAAKTPLNLLLEIPHSVVHANPEVALIGLSSLLAMFLWPVLAKKAGSPLLSKIPAAMIVIAIAIGSSMTFDFMNSHEYSAFGQAFKVGPQFLVTVPSNVMSSLIAPDFSATHTILWWKWLFLIAAVASLESVLTVKAVEVLDTRKRHSDSSKDLTAIGIGNLVAGLFGGLPMIAEVVRSSANLNANAESRWSNFFHGLFIAVFVVMLPQVIHLIPLAGLSGLLVFTGYRLAAPSRWREVMHAGKEQFAAFFVTLVMTVATDLLTGIACGLACELIVNLVLSGSLKNILKAQILLHESSSDDVDDTNTKAVVAVHSSLTFMNLLPTIKRIKLVEAKEIVVDFSRSRFVDHTSMHALHELCDDIRDTGKQVTISGMEDLRPFSLHPMSARRNKTVGTLAKNATGGDGLNMVLNLNDAELTQKSASQSLGQ